MLHVCVAFGEHAPCPAQVPLVFQAPFASHVCVSVPHFPQATGSVWPGAHDPVQAPPTHVWLVHATGEPHCPPLSHVSTPLPEHCFCPGEHGPLHTPATHVPLEHVVAAPHCPQPPHVCTCVPEHCVAPGVHTAAAAHEHAPHAQAAVHVCVPYVLHASVAFGAHAPSPEQPPGCQAPLVLHVCVSVPHWPQGTGLVWPGAHVPVQAPLTHVWPVHVVGAPHCPFEHVSTALPAQRTSPVTHGPASRPPPSAPVSPPPPLLPLLLPPESPVASPVTPSSAASAPPVSWRSSMPASAAHPAPVATSRPSVIPMRAPLRMGQAYHGAEAGPVRTQSLQSMYWVPIAMSSK